MPDKYKHLKREIHKLRSKAKMCIDKKAFDNEEDAFQKGQTFYKCKHCGKFHRSGKLQKFINIVTKK